MKILLVAVNAKYIHSNLAVYSLRAYAEKYRDQIEIAEYTINHYTDDILQDLYKRKPDVVAFSCYIWNLSHVRALIGDFHKLMPDTPIWLGGPEVSYDAEEFLREFPMVRGIMTGEGEKSFHKLAHYYAGKSAVRQDEEAAFSGIEGITYRGRNGNIIVNHACSVMDMSGIPFAYEDMADFKNKIIYYESSRGCPFSCSYCLSSIDKKLRFRDTELVKKELGFFLDEKVPQVKFVDRTFNCSHGHAMEIWRFLKENDNGITNFHFEIAADLLNEEEMDLIRTMRPGLIQLEIGVQSTNPRTIQEIDRTMDFATLSRVVAKIRSGGNIHQHLDLIAGLPYEGYESFSSSFNDVYALKPDQLQLGFLKVLKGSKMHRNAGSYGIVYKSSPPYEVLYTKWLSYDEVLKLKGVEEMVELFYNSAQFTASIRQLETLFETPFELYTRLWEFYQDRGYSVAGPSRMGRYDILLEFAKENAPENEGMYKDLLLFDLYARENLKSRPSWAKDAEALKEHKERIRAFYMEEEKTPVYLKGYEGYQYKQLSKMTHIEVFEWNAAKGAPLAGEDRGSYMVLFDYRNRNPLTKDAAVYVVEQGEGGGR
ncbi:B12-binding domain-containing radical SAM protein [Anaerobium acetethylicum]|uniref:Radical SAM superfamily enzyme YgiQ, UPF0313 family n=1 Tax=Anaerobium acetethylicum TaxID=1619234 RepID=A0A1D3TX39_9FIRM|nr:B12-binding domain-containing radical SAM protein [Anaerobium acetethylicum]SCP98869.1 Radical SAM superfamily enzyme YgiQ, UPF0313 family [Anaerobium acetethylicum]